MCGIFAYQGSQIASDVLLRGLEKLEYRGYDSAWLCVMDEKWVVSCSKSVGKVALLSQAVFDAKQKNVKSLFGTSHFGIAHTRWATHGQPTYANTHPHHDRDEKFFVVHNGIIENYMELKEKLQSHGYEFYSDTDTEIIPALLAEAWTWNLLETVEKVLPKLEWAYALAIVSVYAPWELVAVKWGSPLVFGFREFQNDKEFFVSSDMQALSGMAQDYLSLHDGDLLHIVDGNYSIRANGRLISTHLEKLNIATQDIEKWNFAHFMLKEIFEQANIVEQSFRWRIQFSTGNLYSNSIEFLHDKTIDRIVLVACGTSYHAGLLGAQWIEDLSGISCKSIISSEYLNQNHRITPQTLHIFLSQSGETADSIEVLKKIKENGGMTLGMVNVVGSTIAHLTDCGFFLRAGVEVGVASTKAFMAQLSCLLLLALYLGNRAQLSGSYFRQILKERQEIPTKMRHVFALAPKIQAVSQSLATYDNMFFLGRSYQSVIAQEASLKMKEISYIHSEAYPAGELKHGSLALVDEDFPSVLFSPSDVLFGQNMSSLAEVQARKGKVLVISDVSVEKADWNIVIPSTLELLMPYLTVLTSQLLSYYVALELGRDIDKPRNLAKSVTVK